MKYSDYLNRLAIQVKNGRDTIGAINENCGELTPDMQQVRMSLARSEANIAKELARITAAADTTNP